MFLTERKLGKRIEELKEYRYRDVVHLDGFQVKEDEQGVVNPALPTDFEDWEKMYVGEDWKGRDLYLWLHTDFLVPADWIDKKVVGIFDFGITGGGHNSGFESLLYLDGKMYQGVDANHKEVFLKKEHVGAVVDATFRLWSGLEGGGIPTEQEHRIKRADIAWLDEKVDDLYYMASMVLQTVEELADTDPIQHELRVALDKAFRFIDWTEPGSEAFYASVHEADDYLNEAIDGMDKHSLVTVNCVGHTHIDVAWLWRLKHTREKCSRSFSTVFRMMELYPEYIFLQSQPQLYEFMKEEFPEIYEQIKELVAEGRWEPDGAMWVEADCNLTSGESLTRQILLGSRFFKEEFGTDVEFLWLPDVFGYSWALPQILKKAGIHTFMTTKISWNQYNRMPHDTFRWRGIDGSEVLTHFITTPEPWNPPGSWFYTYNASMMPKTMKGVWDGYRNKAFNKELLVSFGYGDGGGGANRDMLENRRRMDKIPGLPNLKMSRADEYFRRLQETVANTEEYVHTWDGELYLEYHRGTYTSHAYNKRMNRKMELLYRNAEWFSILNAVQAGRLEDAEQEKLTTGWKHILTNQFHDIIPGSSICEVYEDSKKDYAFIQKIAEEVEENAFKNIIDEKENCYTVFNSSSWTKDELVTIENEKAGQYYDADGQELLSQQYGDVTKVWVTNIPAMGAKEIFFVEGSCRESEVPFSISGQEVETPFYKILLHPTGQIVSIYDKEYEREVLAKEMRANVLQIFEDKPLDYDAWDIDIFYQEKMKEINNLVCFEVKECGPLQIVLHFEWTYNKSIISQDMVLYRNNRRIDFATNVDYHEKNQLLKVSFPVDIRSTYATYDVQYGNVRRPNHWNTSWDQARFESVAHRWADLSERNYGVALLNDCKYGHDIKDNVMRLTLLKGATFPDYKQDQGKHELTYSLLPHEGDFVTGKVVQQASAVNDPVIVISGSHKLAWESFVSFDSEQIEVDAVKKSEDGKYIVIRFHDYAGASKKIKMTVGVPFKAWAEADLRERCISGFQDNQSIQMKMGAYEIKTILLKL